MEFTGIIKFIHQHERFVISVHESPDGDAIGSQVAMARALEKLGKTVVALNGDATPGKWSYVDTRSQIGVLVDPAELPDDLESYVLLILDTNDTGNIGNISEYVLPRVRDYYIIDHHEGEESYLAGNLIQKSASSTAEILYQLFVAMGIDVDFEMAQALFTAIVFDTGSFVYPKTTAITFEIAHDLVMRGVKPNDVYSRVYESSSIASLKLQSRVLATLELLFDARVAIQIMTRETLEECGADFEDAELIINIPLRSQAVRVSVFFKQSESGLFRCSLRSKGVVDVATVAQEFGGGGHKTAAGFRFTDDYHEVKARLVERIKGLLE